MMLVFGVFVGGKWCLLGVVCLLSTTVFACSFYTGSVRALAFKNSMVYS